MRAYEVLRQLYPYELGGVHDADLVTVSNAIDGQQARLDAAREEMFADTATDTISRWERRYAIVPAAGESLADRRAAEVAKKRARGGCSESYFTKVASGMGYTITISQHADLFRAGITALPHAVYYPGELYRWTITVHGIAGPATDLETKLNDIKRAHTSITFAYSP